MNIKGIDFVFHSIMYLLYYELTTLGFLLVPVGWCVLHPNIFILKFVVFLVMLKRYEDGKVEGGEGTGQVGRM